jgi:hypothetical protein
MFEFHTVSGTNIVQICVIGDVRRNERDLVIEHLETAIERHGTVRLILEIHQLSGVEPAVVWDDVKFALRHFRDVSRCAVVGDRSWIHWWTSLVRPFVPVEMAYFDESQVARAWDWLRG